MIPAWKLFPIISITESNISGALEPGKTMLKKNSQNEPNLILRCI